IAVLIWGALLAAASEELLFRGALFGAIVEGTRGKLPDKAALAIAAAAAALVFALLHWDLSGGVGIVRVVSALCIGVACGTARALTGSVYAGFALHFTNNAIAIGLGRGWFGAERASFAPWIPSAMVTAGVVGLVAFGVAIFARALARKRAERDAALEI